MWYGMSTKRNMINLFTFLLFILLKTCFLYSKHTKCIDKKWNKFLQLFSFFSFFLLSLHYACISILLILVEPWMCDFCLYYEFVLRIDFCFFSILCWNGFYTNIGKHFPEKLIWFSFFLSKTFFFNYLCLSLYK